MRASTDLDLVKSALGGDRRAFDRLFDVCFGMAARFVRARSVSPEESQEQIRHALEAIFHRLPDYRGEAPLFVFAFVAMTWSLAPQNPVVRTERPAPQASRVPEQTQPRAASGGR
jgi:hypothetical protein